VWKILYQCGRFAAFGPRAGSALRLKPTSAA
jgi:hypothetical protein